VDFVNARRLAGALALAAVALLVAAELTTVFEVTVGSLEVVKRSSTGGGNHGYALLIIAVFAATMTLPALRGALAPAGALVVLGAAALIIALAIDLPDTRASGQLPEALAYENAQAHAGMGFALEIAGGVLLVGAGGVLLLAGRAGLLARAAR
jgi:hypothetical protein